MVDEGFGHWIAGFIDGEGCFYMAPVNRPGGYRPCFTLSVRADDDVIVKQVHETLGIGSVHYYTASSSGSRVVRWQVQAQKDCEVLVEFLRQFPLRAKKRRDFETWARAVDAAVNLRAGRADNTAAYAALRALRDELRAGRIPVYD